MPTPGLRAALTAALGGCDQGSVEHGVVDVVGRTIRSLAQAYPCVAVRCVGLGAGLAGCGHDRSA
jgi:hypothetical protein